jgi:hypothetical protein
LFSTHGIYHFSVEENIFIRLAIIFTPFALIIFGALVMVLPVEKLLKIDRTVGWAIYVNAPYRALGKRRARIFYKIFGLSLLIIGFLILRAITTLKPACCANTG